MVSITISIDVKSKEEMQRFVWVNWSEVAREIFLKRLKDQEKLDSINQLLRNSTLTDEEIKVLIKKTRKGRFNELKSQGLV
ncbi:MAG: hypothetical protein MUO73_00945 [Thermoplasmata archaeon]|jgi:hypothetical protein|nr:hypothetical protein [Thermoplasmata archaeon]